MMFNSGLVAVIVTPDGKILREMNGGGSSTVFLEFGSEYGIRFKNQTLRKALVKVSIDGKDVLGGHQGLVVEGNSESEIKGFMQEGTFNAKNGFRFIEKTDKISEHRGDKIDDGLIRIEFQFEEEVYIPPYTPPRPIKKVDPWQPRPSYPPMWSDQFNQSLGEVHTKGIMRGANFSSSVETMGFDCQVGSADLCCNSSNQLKNDNGITVAGSHVNQTFQRGHIGRLEATKHVMIFQLKGAKTTGEPIVAPLTTRKKVACPTCGRACKSSNKFCPECSTCLV